MGFAKKAGFAKKPAPRARPPRVLPPVRLENLKTTPQYDGHSCGFCACSTLYRYYGMRPAAWELSERLGTDNALPAILPPRMKEWANANLGGFKGTWPFDIFATLHRHGFDTAGSTDSYERTRRDLHRHLLKGHPALALWGWKFDHWIVVEGIDEKGVRIVDSMGFAFAQAGLSSIYKGRVPHETFGKYVLGLIFVKRLKRARPRIMTSAMYAAQYHRGLLFAAGCVGKAVPMNLIALKGRVGLAGFG